jgi:hypothetical protein
VTRRGSSATARGAAKARARFDAADVFSGVVIGNVVVAGPGDR